MDSERERVDIMKGNCRVISFSGGGPPHLISQAVGLFVVLIVNAEDILCGREMIRE